MPAHELQPLSGFPSQEIMIATKDSFEPHSSEQLPEQQACLRRRADCIPTSACRCAKSNSTPTKVLHRCRSSKTNRCASMIAAGRGAIRDFNGTSEEGLPALRRDWILKRGDVEEYDGREVKPHGQRLSFRQARRVRQQGGEEPPRGISRPDQPAPPHAARQAQARSSRSLRMPAPASSRRKWNSSPSART